MRHDPSHLHHYGPQNPGIQDDYFELSESMLVQKLNNLRSNSPYSYAVRNVPSLLGPISRPASSLSSRCKSDDDRSSDDDFDGDTRDSHAKWLNGSEVKNNSSSPPPDPVAIAAAVGAAAGAAATSEEDEILSIGRKDLRRGHSLIREHFVSKSSLLGRNKTYPSSLSTSPPPFEGYFNPNNFEYETQQTTTSSQKQGMHSNSSNGKIQTSSSSAAAIDAIGITALGNGKPTDGPSKPKWEGMEISIPAHMNLASPEEKKGLDENFTSSIPRPNKLELRLTSTATSNTLTSVEDDFRDLKIVQTGTMDSSEVTSVTASMSSSRKSTPTSQVGKIYISNREEKSFPAVHEGDEEEDEEEGFRRSLLSPPVCLRNSVSEDACFPALHEGNEEDDSTSEDEANELSVSNYGSAELTDAMTSLRNEKYCVKNLSTTRTGNESCSSVNPSKEKGDETQESGYDGDGIDSTFVGSLATGSGRRVSWRRARKMVRRKSGLLTGSSFSGLGVGQTGGSSDSATAPISPLCSSDSVASQSVTSFTSSTPSHYWPTKQTPLRSNLTQRKKRRSWKMGKKSKAQKKRPLVRSESFSGRSITTSTLLQFKEQHNRLLSDLNDELYILLADEKDFDNFIKLNKISFTGDMLLGRMLRERTRIQMKRDMLRNDVDMYVNVHCEGCSIKGPDSEERSGIDDRSVLFAI